MSTLKTTFRNCTVCGVSEEGLVFPRKYSMCEPCYKKKTAEYNAKAYRKNREKRLKAQSEYYQERREEFLPKKRDYYHNGGGKEKKRKWAEKNRDSINAYSRNRAKRVRAENPEKARSERRRYYSTPYGKQAIDSSRDRRRRNLKESKKVLDKEIRSLMSSPCVACGDSKVTIDHIVPIAKGGRHSVGNIQPMCRRCNGSKGTKFNFEWRVWRERQAA